jgi:hypothetical protein
VVVGSGEPKQKVTEEVMEEEERGSRMVRMTTMREDDQQKPLALCRVRRSIFLGGFSLGCS